MLSSFGMYLFPKIVCYQRVSVFCLLQHNVRSKNTHLDYTNYPKLVESDLEESWMRGSGPGGQAVNKTSNCVMLRHIPTNIVVKCHLHRTAYKNRDEARKILLKKLDIHYNGMNSIEAQLKKIENKKSSEKTRRQKKIQELKSMWLAREQNKDE